MFIELEDQQINFIQALIKIAPEAYILSHQWRTVREWEAYYNAETDLNFDLNYTGHTDYYEHICIWESTQTQTYEIRNQGEDISDLAHHYKDQLKEKLTNTTITCFLEIDFGGDDKDTRQILELELDKSQFLDLGLSYILDEVESYDWIKYKNWYLIQNQSDWFFYKENWEGAVFSTFNFTNFPKVHNQNRIVLACMEYMKDFLAPIYTLPDRYVYGGSGFIDISYALESLMDGLYLNYVKGTVPHDEYEELSHSIYIIVSRLEQFVQKYGAIQVNCKTWIFNRETRNNDIINQCRLDQYVARQLKSWHTSFMDPMTPYNDPYDKCNVIAGALESEWFWNKQYKIHL